ncbi:MAG: PorP/SprF family type IX secretion system membrane protein [Bacteroidia bacterium]|nr:PorP/SprF family type IX secretion system membrane protein [Bacteroidia bacterium]
MKNLIVLLILFIWTRGILRSQDFHFSQYNENPALVNPALTGATSALRASLVYKDQWRSITNPYSTFGFSFESKFKPSNWDVVDPRRSMTFKKSYSRLAGGLAVYNDKAGSGKMGTFQTSLSLAMFFPLTKMSSLSFGLQSSIVQRKVDNTKFVYPDQYNGIGYDPNLVSGETYSQQRVFYPDFGAGLLWTYAHNEKSIAANNQFKAQIGISSFHLFEPVQSFLKSSGDHLYRKYVFHGNFLIGLPNTMVGLAPSWLVQVQGPSKEILAGLMIKYYLNDDSKYTGIIKRSSIGIGAYYRNADSFIAAVLYEFGRYSIGFSYDINTSDLTKVSTARGGPELTIKFVTPNPFLYQKRAKAMFN